MVTCVNKPQGIAIASALVAFLCLSLANAAAPGVTITSAKWESGDGRLVVEGKRAGRLGTVEIFSVASGESLDTVTANRRGRWTSKTWPAVVPCKVRAESHGTSTEKIVQDAPADCDGGTGGSNVPPTANDDSASTIQDAPVNINLVENDSDADGTVNAASVSIVSHPANGVVNNNNDGTATYTPDSGLTGTDSFTYTVQDNEGASSNVATVNITVNLITSSNHSINSTSQNGQGLSSVTEQPAPGVAGSGDGNHTVLAINDLGMHCGDLDTRISSILPPFNVIHATVIRKGTEPDVLDQTDGIELFYTAASNAGDPALSGFGPTGESLLSSKHVVSGDVYKTNFWDIALQAYEPFYPPGVLSAFYDANPANNADIGLPVPDVERLYLGDGELHAIQQAMPGISTPYTTNEPQMFKEHVTDMPFFLNFPFGYTAQNVNWFEAAGIPLAAFDDAGLENAYPLMRVQVKDKSSGQVLATVDTVTPISGEANCQGCHSAPEDGGNGAATDALGTNVAFAFNDPAYNDVPTEVSIEYASDINILRLHDMKHGTSLDSTVVDGSSLVSSDPIVCQTCHYTPALDLAQVGPRGPENDIPGDAGNPSNGRDQVKNKSMSNVMHSHHAVVTDTADIPLFPDMPPPVNEDGTLRDPGQANEILQQTCYQCHPGRRNACLRGAMANGGMLCQDCHGSMAQVGDDFSRNVSASNAGAFELAADFYQPLSATPRVPWANEPGCGSCHTGDALDNKHGDPNTIGSPTDNIRLMQAFLTNDSKATPIVPSNKRFAENTVENGPATGNPKLYRVSTGHEEVFCEACHGATHAIWPNGNPIANDNVTARQLQGHTGTITECSTCHSGFFTIDDFKGNLDDNGWMKGPHGMHPVGSSMWNKKHKEVFDDDKSPTGICSSCHGSDGLGTVLSKTSTNRVFLCKNEDGTLCGPDQKRVAIDKGTPVGCVECHSNEIGD